MSTILPWGLFHPTFRTPDIPPVPPVSLCAARLDLACRDIQPSQFASECSTARAPPLLDVFPMEAIRFGCELRRRTWVLRSGECRLADCTSDRVCASRHRIPLRKRSRTPASEAVTQARMHHSSSRRQVSRLLFSAAAEVWAGMATERHVLDTRMAPRGRRWRIRNVWAPMMQCLRKIEPQLASSVKRRT